MSVLVLAMFDIEVFILEILIGGQICLCEFEESGKINGMYTNYWPVQMLINNNKNKKSKKSGF